MTLSVGFAVAMSALLGVQPSSPLRTVAGTVRDAQGGAVPGVLVEVACGGARERTTTSATGEFSAASMPRTRCAVTASSDAFEPETVFVDAQADGPATLVLQIRRFSAEVVVTPARGRDERAFNVPEAVSVTSRRDIDSRPYTLVAEVLREEPGILLQQTTSSQISPIIRGFTGQSNVYLLDGVRFNTGQWRPGPSQYVAWIDGGPIDSIEVVRGGGSVQYGSDALGGTVQFLTTPSLVGPRSPKITGAVELSAASAAESVSGQGDLAFQAGPATVRFGGSRRDVDDLRAGDGLDSHSALTRFLGLPSTLVDTRLRGTSYQQGGVYGVATIGLGPHGSLRALYMHESQTGATRYDRVLGGEGLYRSGFDPQTLDFAMARYTRTDVGMLDGLSATFSVNRQGDGRFEQARPGARLDQQEAATTAIGYQAEAHRDFGSRQQLSMGVELYDESISASRTLIDPTVTTAARPDIPDGTSYRSYGVFGQQAFDLVPNRVTLRGGLRFSGFHFDTTPNAALGVVDETVTAKAVTFQVAAVVALTHGVNLTASVNRSFRAANAADLGAIGLTGGGGFEIAPSTAASLNALVGSSAATGAVSTGQRVGALSPETVYQYEVGIKSAVGRFSGAVSGFDLELFDFIQRRALVFDPSIVGTTISGFTVVRVDATNLAYIAQDVRPISTRINVDRARVRGLDAEGAYRLNASWTASAYFSMANGRILATNEFARRMSPAMGGARLRWARERFWAEGVLTFAADQTRLNSQDLTDARIGAVRTRASIGTFFNGTATDLGLVQNGVLLATGETLAQVQTRVLGTANSAPLFTSHDGFAVFGIRAGVRINRYLDVSVLTENLGDVNYRLYGSGVDAPGFNAQVRTRLRF